MFTQILGNEPIKAYLRKALEEKRLPHTLLFSGLDGIGKSLFAEELAIYLLQTEPSRVKKEIHPDYHPIHPEGKSGLYAIETLRKVIDDVHAAPFEAPGKVFVLYDAERMQPAAANALLKTLEEPNFDTTFILLTSHCRQMLPTILSRCTRLQFQALTKPEIANFLERQGHPTKWAQFAQGSIAKALELSQNCSLQESLFSLLSQKRPYHQLIAQIEQIEKQIDDEDPVRKAKQVEQLFITVLMWFRDQHARQIKVPKESLFFPEQPLVAHSLPSIEKIERSIEEARLGIERNMKLSTCLERLLISNL